MPLRIDDPEVDELVNRYLALSGAKTETEAVRKALQSSITALEEKQPLAERVARVQRKAAAAGLGPRDTDDKELLDELWGESQ